MNKRLGLNLAGCRITTRDLNFIYHPTTRIPKLWDAGSQNIKILFNPFRNLHPSNCEMQAAGTRNNKNYKSNYFPQSPIHNL